MLKGFSNILKLKNLNGRDAIGLFLSLLLAFSIWIIHNLSQNYTEVIRVYIKAKSNIEGHSELSETAIPLVARCRTRGFDIIKLKGYTQNNPMIVSFAVKDLHAQGGDNYYITKTELNGYLQKILGNNSTSSSILIDTLSFKFSPETHKKVSIQPIYHLSYNSQYTNVGSLKIVPDSVIIYGKPSKLNKIDRVFTQSFSMENLSSNVHGTVDLQRIKGVRMSQTKINYNLKVERYVEIISTVVVKAINVPRGRNLIIYPSTATVRFRCAFPVNINPKGKVNFYVDFKDFEHSLEGKCLASHSQFPKGVYSYSIQPEVFECVEKNSDDSSNYGRNSKR